MKRTKLDDLIAGILLVTLTIVIFLQVLFRFVFQAPLDWSEELSRYIFIFLVYLTSTIAIRDRATIRIEFINVIVTKQFSKIVGYCTDSISALFLFYMTYLCVPLVKNAFFVQQVSPALSIPMWILYMLQGSLFFLSGLRYITLMIRAIIQKGTIL